MVSKRFDQGGTVASNVYLTLHSGKATIRWKDRIIRLVRDRDDYYLQGNNAFWKWVLPADRVKSTLHTVHGNWIQVPPGDQTFGQFRPFVEFENVGVALGPPSEGDDFKRGPTKQVHGIAAISAIDTRGSGRGIIYFPKDGSAFPVRIVAGTKAVIDFYGWNVFVGIHEPPADQVVKLPK